MGNYHLMTFTRFMDYLAHRFIFFTDLGFVELERFDLKLVELSHILWIESCDHLQLKFELSTKVQSNEINQLNIVNRSIN